MGIPEFTELGKEAKSVLNKNYFLNGLNVNFKTNVNNDYTINLNGVTNLKTKEIDAFLDCNHECKKYRLKINEKWTTNNNLSTNLKFSDCFTPGLNLGATYFFLSSTGHNGNINSSFKNKLVHFKNLVNCDHSCTTAISSLVLKHKEFYGGVQLKYDCSNSKLISEDFSLVYKNSNTILHSAYNDSNEIITSIHKKVNPDLEIGITTGWLTEFNNVKINLGCVYKLNPVNTIRVKANNDCQIGLGLTHNLTDNINFSLSTLINAKKLNQGGHKFGISLNLKA